MTSELTPDEYKEHCRCWLVYLDRLDRSSDDFHFFRVMRQHALECGTRVKRWPRAWPEVQRIFTWGHDPADAYRRFAAAVRESEQ